MSAMRDEPSKLTRYMLSRLLLLNILWVGDDGLGSVFSAATNGTWSVALLNKAVTINVNQVTTIVDTVASVVSIILLVIAFRIGVKAYRVWRKVTNFDAFDLKTRQELVSLQRIKDKHNDVPTIDSAV